MASEQGDLGFKCLITKEGNVFFRHHEKPVGSISGKAAAKFILKYERSSFQQQQIMMAKATGHYKHGNEKQNKK